MASQQSLKDYAYKIFKGEKGYSFELAMKLFPKYFYTVMNYYMEFKMQEERDKLSDVSTAYELFTDALITWNELVAYSNKVNEAVKNADTLEKAITAGNMIHNMYQQQAEVSSEIIKACQRVQIYSEFTKDEQLYRAAQSCIDEHQKAINRVNKLNEIKRRFDSGR